MYLENERSLTVVFFLWVFYSALYMAYMSYYVMRQERMMRRLADAYERVTNRDNPPAYSEL